MVDNFEIIFYTSVFIVPGYILYSTLETLVPRSKSSIINITLKFLTATLIHYIIWSWLIYMMFTNDFFNNCVVAFYLSAIFIVFLSPCMIGFIFAKMSDKNLIRNLLQTFGYKPIHPVPTAWDYKFSKMPEKSWIIVSLQDGKIFYGKFSTNSFSSSEASERDIYIEDVYTLNSEKEWIKRKKNDGILIKSDQIKYIEFFKN